VYDAAMFGRSKQAAARIAYDEEPAVTPLPGALMLVLAAALSCARGTAVSGGDTGVVKAPVPIISQASSHSCGAAALMAALIYFGVFDGPESELHAPLAVTPEQGTHPDRIVAVARERGLTADKRTGLTLADVEQALAQGAVVILAIQAWPDQGQAPRDAGAWEARWEDGHYVVAVGVDDRNLYVMDPSVRGSYGFIPRGELPRRWHDFEIVRGRRVEYDRLGIVIRGTPVFRRFPEPPVRVE
jgi:predicted double-glycine peptidase